MLVQIGPQLRNHHSWFAFENETMCQDVEGKELYILTFDFFFFFILGSILELHPSRSVFSPSG